MAAKKQKYYINNDIRLFLRKLSSSPKHMKSHDILLRRADRAGTWNTVTILPPVKNVRLVRLDISTQKRALFFIQYQ